MKLARDVRIYQVGGAVRDDLLGRPVADRDWVVVGATPEMMVASGYRPVGNDFPVFLHPDTHEEHALARTERKHGTGYRGFEFFASPDVSLEEDLARRDLTINAMARGEDGVLVDPYRGREDLAQGILRHVSPAFAEDPLRVLRVARFAARFGFTVARETATLMRRIAASGELSTLSPERVWRELATGLMESTPSRMLAVLRDCGALAVLMPEVDAVFDSGNGAAAHLMRALDHAAARDFELPARYATLAQRLVPGSGASVPQVRAADRLSARLRLPLDCRDAAHLAARFRMKLQDAARLAPSALLDMLDASDALRRPQRLQWALQAAEADAFAADAMAATGAPARLFEDALRVVRGVDAGAVAREAGAASRPQVITGARADAIKRAVRAARLAALAGWRRDRAATG